MPGPHEPKKHALHGLALGPYMYVQSPLHMPPAATGALHPPHRQVLVRAVLLSCSTGSSAQDLQGPRSKGPFADQAPELLTDEALQSTLSLFSAGRTAAALSFSHPVAPGAAARGRHPSIHHPSCNSHTGAALRCTDHASRQGRPEWEAPHRVPPLSCRSLAAIDWIECCMGTRGLALSGRSSRGGKRQAGPQRSS